MIAEKKLLFVARRKLTLSPDDCKNDTAAFRPSLSFLAELVALFCFASILSCSDLKLVTRLGWCVGNYFPPENMNFQTNL